MQLCQVAATQKTELCPCDDLNSLWTIQDEQANTWASQVKKESEILV